MSQNAQKQKQKGAGLSLNYYCDEAVLGKRFWRVFVCELFDLPVRFYIRFDIHFDIQLVF
jgi:hypothetical protein